MIKSSIVLAIALSLSAFVLSSERAFPLLEGETLNNKQIKLPEDTKGKYTIIGMAFSAKAEENIKTWYNPMLNKFILKTGIWDANYDVNLYFVPMFTGAKKAAYNSQMKKLKQGNREDLFPYILFFKGDLKPYEESLGLKEKAKPYFFVLDPDGNIVYNTSGVYTEERMTAIEDAIEQ